jgi:hypothetical protein
MRFSSFFTWLSMADTVFGAFQDLKQAISKIVVEDDLEM